MQILALTYKTLSSAKPSYLANLISIWPHSAATYDSTKAVSYLLLTAILRPELEFSAFVHLLSGTRFPCVFALLNPPLVFGNV